MFTDIEPSGSDGWNSYRLCVAPHVRPSIAMLPATAAITAEIAGAAADGAPPALSRSAIRGASGRNRRAGRSRRRSRGVHSTMPNRRATSPASTIVGAPVGSRRTCGPPPNTTSAAPASTQLGRDRTCPRRPARRATTFCRAAVNAGTSAPSRPVPTPRRRSRRARADSRGTRRTAGGTGAPRATAGRERGRDTEHEPGDRREDAADDAVGEHDAGAAPRRSAVRRDQREIMLAAAGADRERRTGEQHDLEQAEAGDDGADAEVRRPSGLSCVEWCPAAASRVQDQRPGLHTESDLLISLIRVMSSVSAAGSARRPVLRMRRGSPARSGRARRSPRPPVASRPPRRRRP